jgi:hypothetical protein
MCTSINGQLLSLSITEYDLVLYYAMVASFSLQRPRDARSLHASLTIRFNIAHLTEHYLRS